MIESNLFSAFSLNNKIFRNRIILSPMCQYKANNGFIDEWHLQHYSRFAFSGLGGAFIEATAVSPEGRIGYGCTGIWNDDHIEGLKKITKIFREYNCRSGIQLAHAGRKASFLRPWDGALEMSLYDINRVKEDFKNAAIRSIKAGFDMIEIHGAHGYLLHSFFSPLSNKRTDNYGGSLENRMRFGLEVVKSIKSILPDDIPLFFRISSVDGAENGTKFEENISYARELKKAGVDIIDCSSGGIGGSPVLTKSKIIPGFQVPYSERIKKEANINTMAVGAIIEPDQAEDIITNGRADLIAIGRELLADTQWVYKAATKFGLSNSKDFLPDSYSFFLSRRDDYLDRSAKPA